MKFTKLAATLLCSVALFCGCAKDNSAAIKINDKVITKASFYEDFNRIKNAQLKNAPKDIVKDNSYMVLSLKERYVNDVITRELLSQEFEKRKIEATPKEIEAKKAQVIAQMGSEEKFKKILKENHISDERVNSDMANEVKMEKLFASLPVEKVSNSDIEKFYKQNKAQFTMPERVQAAHILIDANPDNIKRKITDSDKEAKLSSADIDSKVQQEVQRKEKLAREIQQKAAKNPKDFAKLAKQYSDDTASAKQGGDLGYITKEAVVKEFADAAFKQKVGTVSPLVKSQFGYHIILVKDKAAAGTQPLSKIKADLGAYLAQQKKFEAMQNLITGLKNNSKIEFVDESLKPENIKKELDEALKKQAQKEAKSKSKEDTKGLEKIEKENK